MCGQSVLTTIGEPNSPNISTIVSPVTLSAEATILLESVESDITAVLYAYLPQVEQKIV